MTDTIVGDANAIDPKDLYVVEIAKKPPLSTTSTAASSAMNSIAKLSVSAQGHDGARPREAHEEQHQLCRGPRAKTKAPVGRELPQLLDGSYAHGEEGAKKSTMSTEVRTEAMRIAKNIVKDKIKASKQKISHFKPSDITAAAQVLKPCRRSSIRRRRTSLPVAPLMASRRWTSASSIHADEKQVAKVEKERAERKADRQLSAKQAGKVKLQQAGSDGDRLKATSFYALHRGSNVERQGTKKRT